MRYLSLFSGAGGGDLGAKLLGWKCCGYVEWNEYCQRVLAQRIRDGIFDNTPIFGDIKTFLNNGYAARYRGLVNCITGGFPCQPHSIAGKRLGGGDQRDMWPETRECIRIIRPEFAYLENVPGLLSASTDRGAYIGRVLGELSEIGYDARWCVLSASKLGAPHKRERVWILAYSSSARIGELSIQQRKSRKEDSDFNGVCKNIPHPEVINKGGLSLRESTENTGPALICENVSDSGAERLERSEQCKINGEQTIKRPESATRTTPERCSYDGRYWATEPRLGRVAHGVARRVDRLKAIGNGQVSIVAATAFKLLSEGII